VGLGANRTRTSLIFRAASGCDYSRNRVFLNSL
jgi:hypothetical protein